MPNNDINRTTTIYNEDIENVQKAILAYMLTKALYRRDKNKAVDNGDFVNTAYQEIDCLPEYYQQKVSRTDMSRDVFSKDIRHNDFRPPLHKNDTWYESSDKIKSPYLIKSDADLTSALSGLCNAKLIEVSGNKITRYHLTEAGYQSALQQIKLPLDREAIKNASIYLGVATTRFSKQLQQPQPPSIS